MKVVHINTLDTGGAAIAAYRIHAGLRDSGMDSNMLVLRQTRSAAGVHAIPCATHDGQCLQRLFTRWGAISGKYPRRPKGLELFSDTHTEVNLSGLALLEDADIIHLHWVAGVLNFNNLFALSQGKSLVWTLHDMNPFTGGCHYAGHCLHYRQQCGACPQLGSVDDNDLARSIWEKKAAGYNKLSATIVTPSRWLSGCAKQSRLMGRFQVNVIPYGLPIDVFRPRRNETVRRRWGIPESAIVVLFGAEAAHNPRKGLRYLIQALKLLASEKIRSKKIILLIFGNIPKIDAGDLPFQSVLTGMINEPQLLAEIYSASDVYVIPSMEDNLPNTALESLACGTPIVGFRSGGIADIVDHLHDGFLADTANAVQLAEGIRWFIEEIENGTSFSARCRNKAQNRYALDIQTRAYKHLYENIRQPRSPSVKVHSATKTVEAIPTQSWPKITVVTPSYNHSRYLETCIRSVLDQNYPNIEYFILDGGSTDGSRDIIEKYTGQLAFWQSRPDQGQYWAIQEGIARGSGEIVTWLNSDDQLHPHALINAASIFMHRREVDWITGRPCVTNEDGSEIFVLPHLPIWSRQRYLEKRYRDPFIQQEGTFWRRVLWEKAGAKLEPGFKLAGDLELWTRFFRHADLNAMSMKHCYIGQAHHPVRALKNRSGNH
jgi:glycosyltransferase involved in cell wall biosynthesis